MSLVVSTSNQSTEVASNNDRMKNLLEIARAVEEQQKHNEVEDDPINSSPPSPSPSKKNQVESKNFEKDQAPNESKKVMPQTADKSKQPKTKRQREQTDSEEESSGTVLHAKSKRSARRQEEAIKT
ncbi:Pdfr [Acrasis kona]|uniref:Pdfr n=1 Tax=Acrasis kona TaxID=1008807 RepID=A0AAW2Z9J9_9EUKA